MKLGVVLLNLGGPQKPEDVKPFLYNLFSDPDILVGIPTPLRQVLAFGISQIKGPSSIRMYQAIGGGSPQLHWTQLQARQLQLLSAQNGCEFEVAVGMRAWKPTIANALFDLQSKDVSKLILLPLFPHYSTTTVGSCFKEVKRVLKEMQWNIAVQEISSWCTQSGYIQLIKQRIYESVASLSKPYILFSAHSLPIKTVERGDSYPNEIAKTIHLLTAELPFQWSLAFQSRNGRMPWLKPYTENEIIRLAKEGIQELVVVPLSFVSDHIETLYEIDQFYSKMACRVGIKEFRRTRSFNDDINFTSVLYEIIRGACIEQ